jgi:hypothetical protein
MRRFAIFSLLLGCSSDAFSLARDSGPEDVVVSPDADSGGEDVIAPDAKADAADGGSDAGPDAAICSMSKAPLLPASDRCSVTANPQCSSVCGTDAGPALQGYACASSVTAFDDIPSWLAPYCFVSTTDAGPLTKTYCCSLPNACVRNKALDPQCAPYGASKYGWDCPGPGDVNIGGGCTGAGCGCSRNSGTGLACCPNAGP